MRRERCAEDGSASLQIVLVMPVLLALMAATVDLSMLLHANHVAIAAAREGAGVVRAPGGTAAEGRRRAEEAMFQLGGGVIRDATVTAKRGAGRADVQVRGHVRGIVPGLRLPVRASAGGPLETAVAGQAA